MGISDKTVEKHLADVYLKLGFHDRLDLCHYALHRGWIKNKFAAVDTAPSAVPSSPCLAGDCVR